MRIVVLPWLASLALALAVACQTQPARPAAAGGRQQPAAAAPARPAATPKLEAKDRPPVPEDALNVHALAKHAYSSGDLEKAAELYAVLASKYNQVYEPAGAEAHILLGDCLMRLQRYDLAVAAYENAVVGYLEEGRPYLLYVKLGDAYVAAEKFAQAYQVYMLAKLVYGDEAKRLDIEAKIAKARTDFFAQLDAQKKAQAAKEKLEKEAAPPAPAAKK